jgi:hypothetical protein
MAAAIVWVGQADASSCWMLVGEVGKEAFIIDN